MSFIHKLLLTKAFFLLFLKIHAQKFVLGEEVTMFSYGLNNSSAVVDGKIYKFDRYMNEGRIDPKICIYDAKNYSKIKEYNLDVKIPEGLKKERPRYLSSGEILLSKDKNLFFVIFDIASKTSSGQYSTTYRSGEFARSSFLIAQKYSKDFAPIGPSFSLIDPTLETHYSKIYCTGLIFNEDSSQFVVLQNGEIELGSLRFAAGEGSLN